MNPASAFSMPQTRVRSVLRFTVLLLVALGLTACQRKADGEDEVERKPVMTVETVMPHSGSWPETLTASGNVAAWQEAVIGAEVGGARLIAVEVNVGDRVRKGQILARLDPASLRAQQAQRVAEVAQAEASLAKAKAEAERAAKLEQTGSISQQDIEQYRTTAATAEAQYQLAKAQRDVADLQLGYADVVAPDAGIISSRSATVGTVPSPGTELFRMIRGGRLEWRAEVPAEQLGRLQPGMSAQLFRPDGAAVTVRVRQIAPTVDLATRNGLVYCDIEAQSGFTAGQFARGEFVLGDTAATVMPESAIVLRDGHSYLMRIDADRIVHADKVQTGRRIEGGVEILDALPTNARYVKAGGAFLGEGDLVALPGNADAPPAQDAGA